MRRDPLQWETAGRSGRGRVRLLAERIAADPAPWSSIAELADCVALSARSFSRLFAAVTGMSPARFLERSRVALACALLEERCWLASAVARRAGFRNEERMRRAFHRVLGVSPRAYVNAAAARSAGTAWGPSILAASACALPRPTPTPR